MSGILFLVSTSIGNQDDITLRGRRILSEVDTVICEERKVGSTLLSYLAIDKPLVELNEHTETDAVPELLERLNLGETMALISDHGTPLVADPGRSLVEGAIDRGIHLTPIPGASSVIAGLVSSGLPAYRFRFISALSPKSAERRRALRGLSDLAETLLITDAPYRLMPLLGAIHKEMGESREIAVACNLTKADERIVRGTVGEVLENFKEQPFRGEFIAVVQCVKRKKSSKGS